MVYEYAYELGWVVWKSESNRMFFCRDEGKPTVIEFIKRKIIQNT